jgi:hypothetical protein
LIKTKCLRVVQNILYFVDRASWRNSG